MTTRVTLLAVALLLLSTSAVAKPVVYAVAIGNNAPPASGEQGLGALSFADDDAVRYFQFFARFADETRLLSVMDAETQSRFPQVARSALPPNRAELERVIAGFAERMRLDQLRGDEPVFYLAFSGHGSRGSDGEVALAMLDAGLTRQWLYENVLERLPARYVHLFVDACHAEAVVGVRGSAPRELDATTTPITPRDAERLLGETTLARFPHVGALVASAPEQQTHEWSRIQSGVFTHELLSGLRGAADVNADGLVEYSEIQAFMSSAARELRDPRAVPRVVANAPRANPHAPLVSLRALTGVAYLEGASSLGHFYVELENGERYLEAHLSPELDARLAVPPGNLFVVSGTGEARLAMAAGETARLEKLSMNARASRVRGSIDASLLNDLFSTAFSPTYYLGFVDSLGLAPVATRPTTSVEPAPGSNGPGRGSTASLVVGCAAAAAGLVFAGLMLDARNDVLDTSLQRPAYEARERFVRYRAAAMISGAGAVLSGLAAWVLWPDEPAAVAVSADGDAFGLGVSLAW